MSLICGIRAEVCSPKLSPQESNSVPRFVAVFAIPHRQSVPELCLQVLRRFSALEAQKGKSMQNGSMMRTERHGGPDVWEFRWREPGPDGKRKHRRMAVGTTNEFGDEVAARQAIVGFHLCMNSQNESTPNHCVRIGGSLACDSPVCRVTERSGARGAAQGVRH